MSVPTEINRSAIRSIRRVSRCPHDVQNVQTGQDALLNPSYPAGVPAPGVPVATPTNRKVHRILAGNWRRVPLSAAMRTIAVSRSN